MGTETIQTFLNSQASTSVAGFLIIIVSIIAIHYQKKVARQRASLEFLDKLVSNRRLISSSKFLRNYHLDDNKSVALIVTSNASEHKKLQDKIDPILNYFESLSIGVRISIYYKRTVSLLRKRQIINTFIYSRPYVENIRNRLNNDCLFENLEWFSLCLSSPWHKRVFCAITQFFRCSHQQI